MERMAGMKGMKGCQTASKPTLSMSQVSKSATKRMETTRRMRRKEGMECFGGKHQVHCMRGTESITRMPLTLVKASTWKQVRSDRSWELAWKDGGNLSEGWRIEKVSRNGEAKNVQKDGNSGKRSDSD